MRIEEQIALLRIEEQIAIYLDDAISDLRELICVRNKLTWSEACDFTRLVLIGEASDKFIIMSKDLWIKKLAKEHNIEESKMLQMTDLVLSSTFDKRHADTRGLFSDVKLRWDMEKLLGLD